MTLRGLYVITPERPRDDALLVDQVAHALAGGARIVQFRDKSDDRARRLAEAERLRRLCRRHDALFIVNDDVELALAVDADGVHLGRDDTAVDSARALLGSRRLLGISCYNRLENAERAQSLGADYVAFGRFFPSRSKPSAVQAAPALLEHARSRIDLPIVAIGGITPENGRPLVVAGADMLAVIDAVFGQEDIRAAAERFAGLF